MALHIIIDGYNLIRQSAGLSLLDQRDLQAGRDALVQRLAQYRRFKPHRITVVFDGAGAPALSERCQRIRGIDVRYSGPGELADAVIKRMAARDGQRALVVTSDRDIIAFTEARGATAMPSERFETHVARAVYASAEEAGGEDDAERRMDTRKKGPSRRLSRKDRRNRLKYRKL